MMDVFLVYFYRIPVKLQTEVCHADNCKVDLRATVVYSVYIVRDLSPLNFVLNTYIETLKQNSLSF
jgi:hypothetical protein